MLATKFEPTFTGLCIHTIDDLNILMGQLYSDSWVFKKERAENQTKVMFVSRNNLGSYFIAEMKKPQEVKSNGVRKRYRVRFTNPSLKYKDIQPFTFDRNPISYC